MKVKKTTRKRRQPSFKLRRILVPIDFSGISRHALRYAVPLALEYRAKITLLHAIVPPPYPTEMGVILLHDETATRTAQKELIRLSRKLIPTVARGEIVVCRGQPYSEITLTARRLKIDLIVLTTHGHTGLKRVLLGSTAERVLRHAHCPVLSVPER